MTTSINIRFNGESNMGLIHKDLAKMRAEFQLIQKEAMATAALSGKGTQGYSIMQNRLGELRGAFATATSAAGDYQILQQKLVPQSVSYAEAIKQQKVGLVEAVKNHRLMNTVLREQIALQHSSSLAWSKDASGRISSDLIVPKTVPANLINARAQMGMYNKLLASVSQNTINWGKNTQWAGRQLMTGLTLPVTMLGALTAKLAYDMDKQLTQVTKVYGDVTTGIVENNDTIRENAMNTVKATASVYGQSAKNTLGIMADLAAAGKTGNELQQATMAASKASVLGELDYQTAAQATITLQNVYHHSAQQIGDDFNYINAMENQTVLTSKDFTTAIPKISGVMNALGGDLRDVGTLLTAFKGAGIDAAEGANALKTINFRMVATYGKGLRTFTEATGKDLSAIVKETGGKTIPTLLRFADAIKGLSAPKKVQVVRDVFGIYQGSKALLLLEQLTSGSDQLAQAMAVGNNSVAENAAIANAELKKLSDQPFMKIQKAVARMNVTLSEVGAKVLPVLATVIEKVGSLIEGFQGLSGAKQAIAAITVGMVAAAGPIIMLVGLFANLAGNIGKAVSSLGSLILRFKITDAAERTRILQSRAAAKGIDLQTIAINKMSTSLEVLAAEANAATIARERLLKPMSAAGMAALKAPPIPLPMPTDPTAGGRYKTDAAGRLRVAAGRPGAGSYIGAEKALAAERAITVEVNRQAERKAALARVEARRIVMLETVAATEAKQAVIAKERLVVEEQTAIAKEKQQIFTARAVGSGAFGAGMITSMIAPSDTLIGKLGESAMMLGMISMMFPKMLAAVGVGFKTMALGLDSVFGGAMARGIARSKTGIASLIGGLKAVGPYAMVAIAAIGIYWKIAHDNAEKARQEMEDYGNTTKTVADILGFAYQEQAAIKTGAGATADQNVITNKDKFIKDNPAAAQMMIDQFSNKNGIDTGKMWGEAVRQGAAARLHGASAQFAEDTTFTMLKVMGAKISAEEFKATIKAHIDFEDSQAVIDTQVGAINASLAKARGDLGAGLDKWNRDWNPLAGMAGGGSGDFLGAGQDDLTAAAVEAAKSAGNTFYSAWSVTQKSLKPKFMETAINNINVPMNDAFKKFPEQMRKHGIAGGAALAQALSKLDIQGKADLLTKMGFSDEETDTILRQVDATKEMAKEMGRLMGMSTEDIAKVVRPEDVMNWQKIKDATNAQGVAIVLVKDAEKDYNITLDAAAKAHYKISDATKLTLLNMNRLRAGLPATNNLLDGFGEVTISAAEAQETLANKLKTNAGILEEYGFNAGMDAERALGAMSSVRTSVIDDISSQVGDAISNEATNAVAAATASGKAASDALDARISAQEKRADKAAEKLDARQETATKALAKRQDQEKAALVKRQDDIKKAISNSYDARIKKIQDAIKVEENAEQTRQKIFEAEQTRISRLAEMYNKNIDINIAIGSGNMDEAAKIANDMFATQQGWDVGDAAKTSQTASEKKLEGLNLEIDHINKAKDARLEALAVTQKAQTDSLAARNRAEDDALKATQDRAKKELQNAKDTARAKTDVQKAQLDRDNSNKVASVQKDWEIKKAGFERELATLRSFVPRNAAEQQAQINKIQALYKQYGNGTLIPQGKAWSNIVGNSLKTAVIREGNKIKSEVPWAAIGAAVSAGIMKGAFGMTAAQFTKWLNGGVAPAGSPFGAPKSSRSNKSVENARAVSGAHDGGIIGQTGLGSTTGYSRQAELSPSEKMVRTLTGEGVLSRKAMNRIGPAGFHAINNGLPMGGADLMSGVGIAGVPMAMIAGAAKNVITKTLQAVAKKRNDQDLGVDFAGLGSGSGNSQKVYNTLTSMGWTPQAAAGVIGNLMQESGVNPNSHQQGGGPGRGIMQWTESERWATLKKWAGKRDPWALDTQVQFMLKEMNDGGYANRMKGMKNLEEAVRYFHDTMERSADTNMSRRNGFARTALSSFGRGQQPGAAGATSGTFGAGINLPGGAAIGGPPNARLIAFGRKLQTLGFNVAEHPAFGGVAPRPTHGANSWHYKNGAIDVNYDGRGQGFEDAKINSILALAKQYKLRTIWQYPGHYNHSHHDISTGPDMGNFGTGGSDIERLGRLAGMGQTPVEDIMGKGSIGQRVIPVRGKNSSPFGLRDNPILGKKTYHDGTDIVAAHGTPIHSFAGGRVLFAGVDKALGNYTVVQHSNGMLSGYGHQSKQNVEAGQIVKAGQIIGQVGSTGASTGPHLHFQTGTPGRWFDPNMVMPQLKTGGFTLNDGYARLHKAETVLTAPLSKQLNEGIDRFANGPVTSYTIKADFNGATFASDVDVERAFQSLMDKAERRNGSNRRIGNK